jgi:diaminopropionate ammonia-lyase
LGIEPLWYKDEGARFGLRSFKALGGIYGVFRILQAFLEGETGIAGIPSGDFSRSRFAEILSDFTVTCASAGNHGAAVARGADLFGCLSVVFLPSHIPPHRVEAVEELGARTVSMNGSYGAP